MLQKRDALLISLLNRRHDDDDDDDENYYYYYSYNAASGCYVVIGKSVLKARVFRFWYDEKSALFCLENVAPPKKPFPYKKINPTLNREDKP